jgi:predicted O-methyltransferase YrrM
MSRALKNLAARASAGMFHAGQRLGVDVLPRHFYSEIPDVRHLRRTTDWRKPYSLMGVAGANVDDQLAFVASTVSRRGALPAGDDVYARACDANGEPGYGPVEADFLYAFVRAHQPRRIVQIGCGVSTALCLAAAADAGYRPEILAIDPFPTAYLQRLAADGTIALLAQPVESLRPDQVLHARAGDLFFVDSTHTLGPAGEVSRIILELLPRLEAGTFVHFHDIYFPYDYPGEALTTSLFFPHESVLLHAYLANNPSCAISASLSMLHHARPAELSALLPRYIPRLSTDGLAAGPGHFPSSTYLKVLGR